MDQKDSDMIKTTHLDDDEDQTDICVASSVGDEIQSVVVKDKLPTTTISVKGMCSTE